MKKIISVLLCLIMVLSLAACGGQKETSSKSGGSEGGDPEIKQAVSTDTPITNEPEDKNAKVLKAMEDLKSLYTGLETDTLTWQFDESTGTLTISGEGPMRDYEEYYPEWADYYQGLEHVVIGEGVTSIGAGAFYNLGHIIDVTLGENVEFIGKSAFRGCYGLLNVIMHANLKYVGEEAFFGTSLSYDEGFSLTEGILYLDRNSFGCSLFGSAMYIPASLEYIESGAFSLSGITEFQANENSKSFAVLDGVLYDKDFTELICYPSKKPETDFTVPDTVVKMDRDSISMADALETISIPESVKTIEEGAISSNSALKFISVDEKNSGFLSENGILYDLDNKMLLCYPAGMEYTEYTVKEGTEVIGDGAMFKALSLETLNVPEGVKRIGKSAFSCCNKLAVIGLPESLESIDEEATDFCYSLELINYAGSMDEWHAISIDYSGNDSLVVIGYMAEIRTAK